MVIDGPGVNVTVPVRKSTEGEPWLRTVFVPADWSTNDAYPLYPPVNSFELNCRTTSFPSPASVSTPAADIRRVVCEFKLIRRDRIPGKRAIRINRIIERCSTGDSRIVECQSNRCTRYQRGCQSQKQPRNGNSADDQFIFHRESLSVSNVVVSTPFRHIGAYFTSNIFLTLTKLLAIMRKKYVPVLTCCP
jgi:hypothetical protein